MSLMVPENNAKGKRREGPWMGAKRKETYWKNGTKIITKPCLLPLFSLFLP